PSTTSTRRKPAPGTPRYVHTVSPVRTRATTPSAGSPKGASDQGQAGSFVSVMPSPTTTRQGDQETRRQGGKEAGEDPVPAPNYRRRLSSRLLVSLSPGLLVWKRC